MGISPAWPARDREGCPSSHRAVNENEAAQALGMSVHWLRKDRRTKRLIPFFKLGDAVRYDIGRVREAIQSFQEGGAAAQGSAARYPEWLLRPDLISTQGPKRFEAEFGASSRSDFGGAPACQ